MKHADIMGGAKNSTRLRITLLYTTHDLILIKF